MFNTLKRYLGLGPDADYAAVGKKAMRVNMALVVVAVFVMLFIPNIWVRSVLFVVLIAVSVAISLVSREAERARRPQ